MNLKAITEATVKMLASYFTYQAVQVIEAQLRDINPKKALWFNRFSSQTAIRDGEEYLLRLLAEDPNLAERVMSVRAHLAEQIAHTLPPLVLTNIQQANIGQQRRFMERSLQLRPHEEPDPNPETI